MRLKNVAVLVVEEDTEARDVMEAVLRAEGASVRTAASAEAALRLFHARWRPHVLVSDIGLPGQNGCSFMRTIRNMGIRAPAMALTEHGTESSEEAFQAGFQLQVSKRVAQEKLVFLIERMGRG
jgi:CheY-like chemotaxis protein